MQTPRFALASHVGACIDMGVLALLDVRADSYSCARLERLGALPDVVAGLPAHADWPHGTDARLRAIASVQDLARRGLVVEGAAAAASNFASEPVEASALDGAACGSSGLEQSTRLETMAACVGAWVLLKLLPFHKIFEREAAFARRSRDAPNALQTEAMCAALTGAARAFEAARLWFPKDRICLFDSLALLQFLRGRGLTARWVFGVRTHPFEAHCWVQAGRIVLNDSAEHAGGFSLILST